MLDLFWWIFFGVIAINIAYVTYRFFAPRTHK